MILAALMAAALATPPRQYTAQEVDELRHAVSEKVVWGRYSGAGACSTWGSRPKPEVMVPIVEAQVRTDILAGLTAADLRASDPPEDCPSARQQRR